MSTSFQSLPVTKPSTYPGDPFPAPPCPFRGPDAPRVTVLVPALNEADNLPFVLPRIPTWVHEVLLVDGHSVDGTVAVARQIYPTIQVITQQGRGKGAALRSGFAAATGDIVVMLDADGSTDPAELYAFVGALLAGADFAKGSRFLQGGGTADMPHFRQWGNWLLVQLANLLFGTHYTDITYGYNACWRSKAYALALDIDGWACEIISNIRVARHHLRVMEVPSFEHVRIAGRAKLSTWSAGWAILKGILREAFRAPGGRVPRPGRAPWEVASLSNLVPASVWETIDSARPPSSMEDQIGVSRGE
jgi:glycosyltransferase involved in cell wall biosynthesis